MSTSLSHQQLVRVSAFGTSRCLHARASDPARGDADHVRRTVVTLRTVLAPVRGTM
jgi:hypothetical protein